MGPSPNFCAPTFTVCIALFSIVDGIVSKVCNKHQEVCQRNYCYKFSVDGGVYSFELTHSYFHSTEIRDLFTQS